MQLQINEERNNISAAREAYTKGVKACPKSVPLWILASRLEEKAGVTIKARSLLEKARMLNPKNEVLWAEAVRVEERSGSAGQAKTMLARGEQRNLDNDNDECCLILALGNKTDSVFLFKQPNRIAQPRAFSGVWPSGWKVLNNAKVVP